MNDNVDNELLADLDLDRYHIHKLSDRFINKDDHSYDYGAGHGGWPNPWGGHGGWHKPLKKFKFTIDTFDTHQNAVQTGEGTTETVSPTDTGGNEFVKSSIPSVRYRNVKTEVEGPNSSGTSEILIDEVKHSRAQLNSDDHSSADFKMYWSADTDGSGMPGDPFSVVPGASVDLTDFNLLIKQFVNQVPEAEEGVSTYTPLELEFVDGDGDNSVARLDVFGDNHWPADFKFPLSQFVVEQGNVAEGGAPAAGTELIHGLLRQGANSIDPDLDFDDIVKIEMRVPVAETDYNGDGNPDYATGGEFSLGKLAIRGWYKPQKFKFTIDTFDTDQNAVQTGIGTTETQSPPDTGGNQFVESSIPSVRYRNVKTEVDGPPDATGTSKITIDETKPSLALLKSDRDSSADFKITWDADLNGNDSPGEPSDAFPVIPGDSVDLTDFDLVLKEFTNHVPKAEKGVSTYTPLNLEFVDADGDNSVARLDVISNFCRPVDFKFSLSQFVIAQGNVADGGAPAAGTELIAGKLLQGSNSINPDLDFDKIVKIEFRVPIAETDYNGNGSPDFATGARFSLDSLSIVGKTPTNHGPWTDKYAQSAEDEVSDASLEGADTLLS